MKKTRNPGHETWAIVRFAKDDDWEESTEKKNAGKTSEEKKEEEEESNEQTSTPKVEETPVKEDVAADDEIKRAKLGSADELSKP
ncbi:hypothetical protein Y032_0143g2420 [Ancylostoma ceylanicum]|uniref:Uncharacterized protein n=1 Tax=Ancylostoma ceylanicum TaxID=53326 RepID=A0A016T3G5_9BILA|nr:hypothetical protein Y032_0143g2420 [Ancylostoma ceylanicum]